MTMEFIWIINSKCAQRRFFGGKELNYAFVFKNEDNTISLELEENADICETLTINTRTSADNEKAYNRVCEAIIRNSNVIDLRDVDYNIFCGAEEI